MPPPARMVVIAARMLWWAGEEKVFGVQLVPLVNDVGVQHERTKDVALGGGVVGNGSGLFHSTGGWPSSSMISAIKNIAVKKIRT
jgi:hypothetical protein